MASSEDCNSSSSESSSSDERENNSVDDDSERDDIPSNYGKCSCAVNGKNFYFLFGSLIRILIVNQNKKNLIIFWQTLLI